MKTTLDLPDELMRAVKVRAAKGNRRLEDLVAELIERGLAAPAPVSAAEPVRLDGSPLTIEDIEAAIGAGRD